MNNSMIFADCEKPRWEGKVWKLGVRVGKDALVPHTSADVAEPAGSGFTYSVFFPPRCATSLL